MPNGDRRRTRVAPGSTRSPGPAGSSSRPKPPSGPGACRLKANPGFAVASVITLALGIGASTAIFSAVNPILFEPLPYPQAGRVVMVSDAGADRSRIDVTFCTYRELLARSRAFEALA